MTMRVGSGFSKDGLIFHVDAGNSKSYPGSGTTWFDLSGKGLNITISGASWNSAGYFTVSAEGQLTVPITNPNASLLEFEYDDPKTLICIAQIPSDTVGAYMSKMGANSGGSGYYRGWDLLLNTGPVIAVHNINRWAVTAHRRTSTWTGFDPNDGNIHMVAGTYDGLGVVTGNNMYYDAEPASTIDDTTYDDPLVTTMVDSAIAFSIGSRTDQAATALPGDYYMCSIYNRELSGNEIREYLNSFRARFGV